MRASTSLTSVFAVLPQSLYRSAERKYGSVMEGLDGQTAEGTKLAQRLAAVRPILRCCCTAQRADIVCLHLLSFHLLLHTAVLTLHAHDSGVTVMTVLCAGRGAV